MHTMMFNQMFTGLGDYLVGNPPPSRSWCCKIIGTDPVYKFKREFLKPNIDYSEANSMGSRYVYAYYNLEEGFIYEVSAPVSRKHTERYFCKVENDHIVYMEKEEVLEWLKLHLA
jgi:hypothetical protein